VCLGKPVDQRSDIFSLGIVLFECLAGRMPFTDESPLGLMLEVVKAEIPDVCTLNAEVDPELSRILTRMIAKDPAERYQSCHELVADLGQHPLVAKGGPITLQTKMSTAAATMVGQKTPISGQQSLPSTTPTPRPMSAPTFVTPTPVSAATTAARATPDVGAHQSVLDRGAPARSPLPLAIAAVVLLLLVGGVWAFRDRLPAQLAQWFPSQIAPPAAAPVVTTTVVTTPSAPAAPTAPTAPAPPPPPATGSAGVAAVASPANASLNDILNTKADAKPGDAANTAGATAAAADAAPAPRASQVDPLRDLPAAQAAQAVSPPPPSAKPQPRVAMNTPPPPVSAPPRPHIPTIAVIAAGDEAVAEPAGHVIEQALSRKGFNLIDEAQMPRIEHLLGGSRANIPEILKLIERRGIDAVIVVSAKGVGSQQVTFYGQSDNLMTAQLSITAYAVDGRRKLGAGWSDNVNFTAMSAKDKAEEAVEPMLGEIEDRLAEFRPARHKG